MNRTLAVLLVLAPSLAACLAPPATEPAALDATEEVPPAWTPHPKGSAEPALSPSSGFVETEWGYVRADWKEPATPEPSIFYMEGYGGASAPFPTHYLRLRDGALLALSILPHDAKVPVGSDMPNFPGFTQVRASLRGTGCSAGTFTLFDPASALDGREAIEWIAAQNWTTPKVGMYGASYSGLTAFYVAATAPPHLAAVAPNLVIEDYYRSIAYPGGVLNDAFPVAWPTAFRPEQDVGGTLAGVAAEDEICAANAAGRRPALPQDHATAVLLTHPFDETWYPATSLYAVADKIRAPITMAQGWQDEQTGPRGGAGLFRLLPDDVPKRLVATNGGHGDTAAVAYWADLRWFDHFLKGVENGVREEPPVQLHFQSTIGPGDAANFTWGDFAFTVASHVLYAEDFPVSASDPLRLHLREGGLLSSDAPTGAEEPDAYVTGSPRRAWTWPAAGLPVVEGRALAGPDSVVFVTEPLERAVTVAGPIAATLYVETTAPDMDLFVTVADVDADGNRVYLQRGLLRASHRALDPALSQYTPDGDLLVPHHPHTRLDPVPVGDAVRYDVEVFPLAHVFHAGHRILVEITTPPLVDGIWGYAPLRLPGVNRVVHDAEHPSSILLPTVEWPNGLPPEPACGEPLKYFCVPPGSV